MIGSVYDNDGVEPCWIKEGGEKSGNESLLANKKINPCGILYMMKSVTANCCKEPACSLWGIDFVLLFWVRL